ncbi:AMP-dependent synthetase/ligase [Chytriomyces cf. hyalinus JEL632]|nr:AMP-dependent synthetase/ligase [Chytriomyces cf. hyalinus JEL632]
MYTSGSTGLPKGVMLTHANVVATVGGYCHLFKRDFNADGVGETYLSFLPLSQILEFSVEFLMLFYSIPIGYGSPKTLVDTSMRNCKGDLRELRPTLLAGVPAVWDAIRKGVDAKVNAASSILRAVFKGRVWAVKDQVGGRLKMGLSAGGPIPKSTHEFLNVTAVRVVSAYEMTESTAGLIIQEVRNVLGVVGAP